MELARTACCALLDDIESEKGYFFKILAVPVAPPNEEGATEPCKALNELVQLTTTEAPNDEVLER